MSIQLLHIVIGLSFTAICVVGLSGWGSLIFTFNGALKASRGALGLTASAGISIFLALTLFYELRIIQSLTWINLFLVIGVLMRLLMYKSLSNGLCSSNAATRAPAFLLFAIGLTVFVVTNSTIWQYNNIDDLQGYLVYIDRVFQTGFTGNDPFSYRRFESGLGGGTYLYTLGAMLGGVAYIRVIDLGVGTTVLSLLLAEELYTRGAEHTTVGFCLIFVSAAVLLSPAINMTPDVIGMCMLYATARVGEEVLHSSSRLTRAAIIALMLFGLVMLKSVYIVPAGIIGLSIYSVLLMQKNRLATVLEAFAALSLLLILCLPWMLLSLKEAGTLFFPIFGSGRLSISEASSFASVSSFLKAGPRIGIILALPLIVGISQLRCNCNGSELYRATVLVLCSLAVGMLQLKYSYAGYRYGYSSAMALLLLSLSPLILSTIIIRYRVAMLTLLLVVVADLSIYPLLKPSYGGDGFRHGVLFSMTYALLRGSPSNERVNIGLKSSALSAQNSIPKDAVVLARLTNPSLLDFRRNVIYVSDWPGMTGIGDVPRSDDPHVWGQYLERQKIKYFMYSYADQAGMQEQVLRNSLKASDSLFYKEEIKSTLISQIAFKRMLSVYPKLFDDGKISVIQLFK